ncbi:MAG: YicC family protein [Pelosinus sp.]|nr:YicC family protein [Pelosinus sp.]
MLKSMTGFGRGEYLDSTHRFTVEIKAVNHRFNEVVIRMPKNYGILEDKIRRAVSGTISRGRSDVFITVEEFGNKNRTVRVDKELAMAYHKALGDLSQVFGAALHSETENVYHIAKYPDIIKVEDLAEDVEALWPNLSTAIDTALNNLMSMRLLEGENIQKDLLSRLDKLDGDIQAIEARAPEILTEYREKLLIRMRELLTAVKAEPDETRLLQETALFAERTNFTEELVRLHSHVAQFRLNLQTEDAVGRKLDFIVQEINRETNTIASKASDAAVANIVIEIKSEIEKIREQIQNIE